MDIQIKLELEYDSANSNSRRPLVLTADDEKIQIELDHPYRVIAVRRDELTEAMRVLNSARSLED